MSVTRQPVPPSCPVRAAEWPSGGRQLPLSYVKPSKLERKARPIERGPMPFQIRPIADELFPDDD